MVIAALFFVQIVTLVLCHRPVYESNGKESFPTGSGGRIVGGYPVSVDLYPWFMALVERDNADAILNNPEIELDVICGATLISPKHAVSAAHCFGRDRKELVLDGREWIGVMGVKERCPPVFSSFQEFSKVVRHENSTVIPKNDIALIFLSKAVHDKTPICLPPPGPQHTGPAFVIGFGSVVDASFPGPTRSREPEYPCTLMGLNVKEFSRRTCNKSNFSLVGSPSGVVCAGILGEGKGTCNGDSGGPLMYRKNKKYFLEAIASFVLLKCGMVNTPQGYTRVNYFLDWLASNLDYELPSQEGCGEPRTTERRLSFQRHFHNE